MKTILLMLLLAPTLTQDLPCVLENVTRESSTKGSATAMEPAIKPIQKDNPVEKAKRLVRRYELLLRSRSRLMGDLRYHDPPRKMLQSDQELLRKKLDAARSDLAAAQADALKADARDPVQHPDPEVQQSDPEVQQSDPEVQQSDPEVQQAQALVIRYESILRELENRDLVRIRREYYLAIRDQRDVALKELEKLKAAKLNLSP